MKNNSPLYGLVMCGGKSSRMGSDKSLLNYHGKPQRYFIYEMLDPLCEKVFISCSQEQAGSIPTNYHTIPDDRKFGDIGPMAALLSAFGKYPDASFLAVGCDYPFLQKADLAPLLDAYKSAGNSTAFHNEPEDIFEPLLAVYHNNISPLLNEQYGLKNYSLNKLLTLAGAVKITPGHPNHLISVDTPNAYEQAIKIVKTQ